MNVLEARVKNRLKQQKPENKEIPVQSRCKHYQYGIQFIDEEYLKTAISKVEDKLADETYDFEHFAMDMSSKSTLHRKLKSLTGPLAHSLRQGLNAALLDAGVYDLARVIRQERSQAQNSSRPRQQAAQGGPAA